MKDADLAPLFERAYNVILGYAYNREGSDYMAQELTHQVMERAWRKRHLFDGTKPGQFVNWCKVIMSREWADNPTKRRQELIPLQLDDSLPIYDRYQDPAKLVELDEAFEMIASMRPDYAESFILITVLGYTAKEAAEMVGASKKAVEKRAYWGRKHRDHYLELV